MRVTDNNTAVNRFIITNITHLPVGTTLSILKISLEVEVPDDYIGFIA